MRTKPSSRTAAVIAGVIAVVGVLLTACVQPSPHSPLRVTVTPSKTEVRIREPFTLALRVENISQTDQTIRVMTCSWQDEWKSSNSKIELGAWPCPANRDVEIVLPPGGAYMNLGDITIDQRIWGKTPTFRMGFTSLESKKTIWSDEVKLHILPAQSNAKK